MQKILLHLGFDYFSKGRTGVGAYQANIIWGLACEYDIVVPQEYSASLPPNAHPVVLSPLKKKIMALCKKFCPITVFFEGYDVVIIGGSCFRHSKKTKQYNIVHDLMSFTEPQNYKMRQRLRNKIAVGSYKNADKLIAVSQSTKQALHDLLKIDFNKIVVIPNITEFYIERKAQKDFLFIGDMRRTKNLALLISGFAEYIKADGGEENLIIAGSKKYEYPVLQALVKAYGIADRVLFPGYVTDEQKRNYFSQAKAFIFLSDNEGFGIPLLEAAVNGIPVLCSDIPVFHEVLNEDFAVYVDNKGPEKIAAGFKKVREKVILQENCEKLKQKYSVKLFNERINELIR